MNEDPSDAADDVAPGRQLDRRSFLLAGGAAAVIAACSSDAAEVGGTGNDSAATTAPPADAPAAPATEVAATTAAPTAATSPFTAAEFEPLATCRLLPAKAAGPFPLDEQFDRRDVTEGYPGHPLRLGLRVIDEACAPVPGAVVEIWHTDASGDYSAFADGGDGKDEAAGTTFLRGSQAADGDGIVEFMSLYPGWYPGRCVHIHLRVHRDDAPLLTSQLFFDDAYSAEVFTTGEYAAFGPPDTLNSDDRIAGDPAAEGTLLHLAVGDTTNGPGTVALLNLGVS